MMARCFRKRDGHPARVHRQFVPVSHELPTQTFEYVLRGVLPTHLANMLVQLLVELRVGKDITILHRGVHRAADHRQRCDVFSRDGFGRFGGAVGLDIARRSPTQHRCRTVHHEPGRVLATLFVLAGHGRSADNGRWVHARGECRAAVRPIRGSAVPAEGPVCRAWLRPPTPSPTAPRMHWAQMIWWAERVNVWCTPGT
jgi:hypothetical protein